jgi:hypothetical protein
MSNTLKRKWSEEVGRKLVGRKIVAVRYMTDKERKKHWWGKSAVVIKLDDGAFLYPMSDDEGNEAGAIATTLDDLPVIQTI